MRTKPNLCTFRMIKYEYGENYVGYNLSSCFQLRSTHDVETGHFGQICFSHYVSSHDTENEFHFVFYWELINTSCIIHIYKINFCFSSFKTHSAVLMWNIQAIWRKPRREELSGWSYSSAALFFCYLLCKLFDIIHINMLFERIQKHL